ncbi:MAG: MarR family winged helix-turn-helix transcriptional regulator [Parvularculaceae bacterium]
MADPFDLENFLPYRLHQAAEQSSLSFRKAYQDKYGMTRPDWRVLFNIGQYGPITAVELSRKAFLHKTKISRAVVRLERRRWLRRIEDPEDRRSHALILTKEGMRVFADLRAMAKDYNDRLTNALGRNDAKLLLAQLRKLEGDPPTR